MEKDSFMNEETAIFPLPAGADLREQAAAMAAAAWLMGGPRAAEPPTNPIEDDMDDPRKPSD